MTTLEKLQSKAEIGSKTRMPSISEISKMLTELGVEHITDSTVNIVEYRSKGRTYVNSRHYGKRGKKLEIRGVVYMDTSDSYYSWNTDMYARNIVNHLRQIGKIK